jgi:hypothetical protein
MPRVAPRPADPFETEVGFLPSGKAVPIAAGFRPRGNSVQLSAAFFGDLHHVWEVEGIEALTKMARSDPVRFCEMGR